MKKSQKLTAPFAAVLTFSLILSGCSSKNAKEPSTAVETAEERETPEENKSPEESDTAAGSDKKSPDTAASDDRSGNSAQNEVLDILIENHMQYGSMTSGDRSMYITIDYDSALLDTKYALAYPELYDTLLKEAQRNAALAAENITDFENSAKEFLEDDITSAEHLFDEKRVSVIRADSKLLSFREEVEWFGGGAHGNYGTTGKNYDTASGRKLSLNDVIADKETFIEAVKNQLNENYNVKLGYSLNIDSGEQLLRDSFRSGDDSGEVEWTLGYTQISVYFSPYTLGSYAEGAQTVVLSFDQYPELVKQEYTENLPDSYIYRLTPYENTVFEDLDNDGSSEKLDINIAYTGQGEGGPEEYTLTIQSDSGGSDFRFRSYGNCEPFFIKNTDGSCCLYLFTSLENDYSVLQIYEITDSDVIPASFDNFAPFCLEQDYEEQETGLENSYRSAYRTHKYTLTSPEHMMLESRLSALSTCFGYKDYHADAAGLPQSEQDFLIADPLRFQLKQDFELELCGKDEKPSGKKQTVAKGTVLYPYATDGISYLLFKDEDGTLFYGEIEVNQYPQLINGVVAEEIFDGMMYSG